MAPKKAARKVSKAAKAARKATPRKAPAKAAKAKTPAKKAGEGAILDDWRPRGLDHLRALIRQADPDVVEEVKWRKPSNPAGVPVWSHDGMVCTGETYKDHLRLTFFRGSALKDPSGLFNANLVGVRRAILVHEGEAIDEAAFKALVREAVALNASG